MMRRMTVGLVGLVVLVGAGNVFASMVITEVGTGTPDYWKIQNVGTTNVNLSAWAVVANFAGSNDINAVHDPIWTSPDPASVAPGEVIHRPDTAEDDIFWRTSDKGWLAIFDASREVVDFVVWGYSAEELDAMHIDIAPSPADPLSPFSGNPADTGWSGDPVSSVVAISAVLERFGNSDTNTAADFRWAEPIPEPSTLALLFTATIGLLVCRLRRQWTR